MGLPHRLKRGNGMNHDALMERIFGYSNAGEHEKIEKLVFSLPQEERSFSMVCQLACAYNNLNRLDESIRTLLSIEDPGRDHPVWNFFLGYAYFYSGRKETAKPYLQRAKDLEPAIPMGDLLARCAEEPVPVTQEFFLERLRECIPGAARVEGGGVLIPGWNMRIEGSVESGKQTTLHYHISCPEWDQRLYECCSAFSFTLAQSSFVQGMLSAIQAMMNKRPAEPFETRFDGERRQVMRYESGIVSMGTNDVPNQEPDVYWKLLGEKIKPRLGKGRLNGVKIYAAKVYGETIGECRINDTVSRELSEILKDYAGGFTGDLVSQKQFFLFRQDTEPYPYTQEAVNGYTEEAVKLFDLLYDREDFDDAYDGALHERLGDPVLVYGFHYFLPEIAAEQAFPEVGYAETVTLNRKEVYKSQIRDYQAVKNGFHAAMGQGLVSDEAYRKLIAYSATYGCIAQAQEAGVRIEEGQLRMTSLQFNPPDGFRLR